MGVDEHPWNDYTPAQRRQAVLEVLRPYGERLTEYGHRDWYSGGQTASQIAHRLRIPPARRAGRGAVQGSWTGNMAPALRAAPTLVSAVKAGLAMSLRNPLDDHHRAAPLYYLTVEGERVRGDSTKRTP